MLYVFVYSEISSDRKKYTMYNEKQMKKMYQSIDRDLTKAGFNVSPLKQDEYDHTYFEVNLADTNDSWCFPEDLRVYCDYYGFVDCNFWSDNDTYYDLSLRNLQLLNQFSAILLKYKQNPLLVKILEPNNAGCCTYFSYPSVDKISKSQVAELSNNVIHYYNLHVYCKIYVTDCKTADWLKQNLSIGDFAHIVVNKKLILKSDIPGRYASGNVLVFYGDTRNDLTHNINQYFAEI